MYFFITARKRSLGQGNVFTGVRLSVILSMGGRGGPCIMSLLVWLPGPMFLQGGLRDRDTPLEGDPSDRDPPPPRTVKNGKYASYWNAFLCKPLFCIKWNIIETVEDFVSAISAGSSRALGVNKPYYYHYNPIESCAHAQCVLIAV